MFLFAKRLLWGPLIINKLHLTGALEYDVKFTPIDAALLMIKPVDRYEWFYV